jgi:hypothetical protein
MGESNPAFLLYVLVYHTEIEPPRTARAVYFCFVYPGLPFVLVAGSPSFSPPTTPG